MDAIERIENWFAGEHEDGDFIRGEREYPFEIIGAKNGLRPGDLLHETIGCGRGRS
jgi:hypothetical protein